MEIIGEIQEKRSQELLVKTADGKLFLLRASLRNLSDYLVGKRLNALIVPQSVDPKGVVLARIKTIRR